MKIEIFLATMLIALILTNIIAKKGSLGALIGISGGILVGLIAGAIVSVIDGLSGGLNLNLLIPLEIVVVLAVGAASVLCMFYRDPKRVPPAKKGIIISPADGRIIYIRKIEEGKIPSSIKGKHNIPLEELAKVNLLNSGYIIGIVMSILDVHVTRSPISGKIILNKHTQGKFFSLKKSESEVLNERNTLIMDNNSFKIGVVEIASRLVRRIDTYIAQGDFVDIGKKIGMIKFGSQVDIILPEIPGIKIVVSEGEKVRGGATIIAEYNQNKIAADESFGGAKDG
jgi:phosphatidylserine decarboxylase